MEFSFLPSEIVVWQNLSNWTVCYGLGYDLGYDLGYNCLSQCHLLGMYLCNACTCIYILNCAFNENICHNYAVNRVPEVK